MSFPTLRERAKCDELRRTDTSRLHADRPATVGSGLPLGFFAFAIGILLLACASIGWIPADEQRDVGTVLIAFVFPLELIATILPSARDTLGGTTLGLFTISWLTFGWIDRSAPAGSTSVAVGVYLGGYEQQSERLEAEAGVRQQL